MSAWLHRKEVKTEAGKRAGKLRPRGVAPPSSPTTTIGNPANAPPEAVRTIEDLILSGHAGDPESIFPSGKGWMLIDREEPRAHLVGFAIVLESAHKTIAACLRAGFGSAGSEG